MKSCTLPLLHQTEIKPFACTWTHTHLQWLFLPPTYNAIYNEIKLQQHQVLSNVRIKYTFSLPATDSSRTAHTPLYPPVKAVPPYSLPPFFPVTMTGVHYNRWLWMCMLNWLHSDLTWPDLLLVKFTCSSYSSLFFRSRNSLSARALLRSTLCWSRVNCSSSTWRSEQHSVMLIITARGLNNGDFTYDILVSVPSSLIFLPLIWKPLVKKNYVVKKMRNI